MAYFNYHRTVKKLISDGKLKNYYFTDDHNGICPALVFVFDDLCHPIMPIRKERWAEYFPILSEVGRLLANTHN
ncbi:MAG: thermostable hemolysin delta-VPH [Clostridiales bacterium]|nr:thermostable hemolysin delta-VPH [Clostridiales bacterium]